MSNSGRTGDDEGSPIPPQNEDSPCRRSSGSNAAHGSPRGRGSGSSPRPSRGTGGGSSALSSDGGGLAAPVVGGGTSGSGGVGTLRICGSPVSRKRVRNGGAAADGGEEGGRRTYPCSVCSRVFESPHALFGHMRAHPDRGWTGAHPPPAFRAEEDFVDLRIAAAAAAEGGGAAAAVGEERTYRVPDLNNPPPPDAI